MTCEQFFAVIPWPQFVFALVFGFLVGAACGYAYGRRTSTPSREVERARMDKFDWRAAYERVAPALVTFCILCSMFASVGVYVQGRTNRAQDQQRTDDNTRLIECFDKFATDLSGSLPPVRVATANRDAKRDLYDKAVFDFLVGDRGLGGLLIRAQKGVKSAPGKDLETLIATKDRLAEATRALNLASAELTRVRAENPYPPPPSKFCELP